MGVSTRRTIAWTTSPRRSGQGYLIHPSSGQPPDAGFGVPLLSAVSFVPCRDVETEPNSIRPPTCTTPVPQAEIFTSLQSGLVAGGENALVTILSAKFYEVQKYVILTNHVRQCTSIIINERVSDIRIQMHHWHWLG